MKATFTWSRWLAPVATALFLAACAQSNGDVNRVQPNVIRKTDLLDGQWFYRNTVTYTPFNTQFTFPGQTGNMEKLVWEFQEGNLVGYRSYPYTPGAEANVDPNSKVSGTTAKYCDAKGTCTGGQKYYGAPVVAFPVESHFDIQRGYNTATGEQTNVVSENATDRYWNQREFARVNWAQNVLNKNSGMNWGTVQNPLGGSSQSSWIQPNEKGEDPYDWPTFEYDANKKLKYFDVTGRYMANPDQMYFEDWGWIPLCWFAYGVYDCSSSEIKMRVSISKVDQQWSRDYEPLIYPNDLMSLFGYFRTERLNYDKKFGYNDSAVIRLGQRHRVWKEYYQKDANGEPDSERPIPFATREPKPIVYYFTRPERMGGTNRYEEFWEPGVTLEKEYDRAFRRAIAAAQGKSPQDVRQMFYLCHNPVRAGDRPECGDEGFSPKVGDLRYSFVHTIAEPVANGLLGYGPSSADPETGQLVSGMANTYLWGVDMIGRQLVDHILLLTGEKQVTEYISGQDMRDYLAANPVYNMSDVKNRRGNLEAELQGIPQRNEETKGAWEKPTRRTAQLFESLRASNGLPVASRDEMRVAAEKLKEFPSLESAVLDNPDMQYDLVNLLPPFARERAKNDAEFRRTVSRSVLTNIQASRAWQKARLEYVSKNNIYLAEFWDRSLWGIALEKVNARRDRVAVLQRSGHPTCANSSGCTEVEAKRVADEEIARQFRQQVWLATSLHEIGHTFNLRHNFQGSFDAVNYFDRYWDLKRESLTVTQNASPKIPRTPADLKLAADGTEDQIASGMYDLEYSSIMDYSGKRTGDWKGIGKYDEAAIIFAYSGGKEPGYVEVFDTVPRRDSKSFPGSDGAMMTISGAGTDLAIVNATYKNPNTQNYTERFHYSTVPMHFGEGNDLSTTIVDGIAKLKKRKLAKWADVKADEERVAAILKADPSLVTDPDRAMGLIGNPVLRVPYMFCSDESADGPVLSCYRFDRGPDYYEKARQEIEDYWYYYYDSHYKRDRLWFSGNSALNSAFGAYYNTANIYRHWVYRFYKQADRSQEQTQGFKVDPLIQDYWTMAVLDGVNQNLNVMSVPPFGLFMFRNLRSGERWDVISEGDDFDMLNDVGRQKLQDLYTDRLGGEDYVILPRGLGRRMYSRYDFKSGFGFWDRMMEAGHYNDQVGAMFSAVIPWIDLQGVDMTADDNRYNIPYYLVFREEMTRHFGALWSNNEDVLRPIMYKTYDSVGRVTDRPALLYPRFVSGADLFQGFDYPKALPALCGPSEDPGTSTPPKCFKPNMNAAPANIQASWTSRIYALYLGMALFRVNFDMDYAKANQVYKLGGFEQFQVATGYHAVEVTDIVTGARYVAIEKDGAPYDSTSAVRMINIANVYLQMVQDPTRCPLPDYLTVLGYTCMAADQANNPALVEDRRRFWTEVFQDQIRDLDLMRGMYQAYGKTF